MEKVKAWVINSQNDLFIAVIIFLVGIIGFGLGRLSIVWPQSEPITIEEPEEAGNKKEEKNTTSEGRESSAIINSTQGRYVASKSGSAYHFPWCPGAQKIKEANKIWFNSKEEAEAKGYKAAGNCEGL
ncbi:MAG: hypothetical protein HYT37_02585 [Candidatus Sungbacteria bacterium]|nr:hypothetical protein [Candidatus Sungbacteria bacterium]